MEQEDNKYSFSFLSLYFDHPLSSAAKELGICCTALKKICRKHGIQRWPYRTLKSINRTIEELESCSQTEKRDIELNYLKSKREMILRNPSEDLIISLDESGFPNTNFKLENSDINKLNDLKEAPNLLNHVKNDPLRLNLPISKKQERTPLCYSVNIPVNNNNNNSLEPPKFQHNYHFHSSPDLNHTTVNTYKFNQQNFYQINNNNNIINNNNNNNLSNSNLIPPLFNLHHIPNDNSNLNYNRYQINNNINSHSYYAPQNVKEESLPQGRTNTPPNLNFECKETIILPPLNLESTKPDGNPKLKIMEPNFTSFTK